MNRDRAALELAMKRCATEDAGHAEQLASMLHDRPWREVAEFAAYCCQGDALHLKPWQEPPGVASENDPNERDVQAQALLRRMLAANVSRYHPDPLAALEKVVLLEAQ